MFHYEFEFIHPFSDGNGRMGRLWQTLILMQQYPVFEFLPVETLIKENPSRYYDALNRSDKEGQSTPFIEYMLEIILLSLTALYDGQNANLKTQDRIDKFADLIGVKKFSRKDYLQSFKQISSATASRDLRWAVEHKILKKSGDKRQTTYSFIK